MWKDSKSKQRTRIVFVVNCLCGEVSLWRGLFEDLIWARSWTFPMMGLTDPAFVSVLGLCSGRGLQPCDQEQEACSLLIRSRLRLTASNYIWKAEDV